MLPLVIPFPDIDPAIFTLSLGSFQFSLRWYALAYIVGLVVGWRMMVSIMRRPALWPGPKAPMTTEQPEALLTWIVLGVVLGGRLGYVLFYQPAYFAAHPADILKVWDGGMSFHGGFLGVIVATYLFTRNQRIPLLQAGDAVALGAPLGIMLGRLANFINGELYGRPTDVAWAMQFPTHNQDGSRNWQVLTEPRHPSQLYEAGLEGALLLAVMWFLATRGGLLKRPGAVIGVFFIGYGLARAFVENFRQGDPQFVSALNPNGQVVRLGDSAESWGLTMGQILSLPMVAIGLGFLVVAWRRRAA